MNLLRTIALSTAALLATSVSVRADEAESLRVSINFLSANGSSTGECGHFQRQAKVADPNDIDLSLAVIAMKCMDHLHDDEGYAINDPVMFFPMGVALNACSQHAWRTTLCQSLKMLQDASSST